MQAHISSWAGCLTWAICKWLSCSVYKVKADCGRSCVSVMWQKIKYLWIQRKYCTLTQTSMVSVSCWRSTVFFQYSGSMSGGPRRVQNKSRFRDSPCLSLHIVCLRGESLTSHPPNGLQSVTERFMWQVFTWLAKQKRWCMYMYKKSRKNAPFPAWVFFSGIMHIT